jgi:hypothetical protein
MQVWNSLTLRNSLTLWNSPKLLGSTFRPRAVHWHEFTAVGALLTCLAVVLNVGPFTGTFRPEAPRATTEQPVESALIARSQIGTDIRPDRAQSDLEATEISARFRPVTDSSSIPDGTFARLAFQPISSKGRDVETPAEVTRQGPSDSATRPLATIVGVWAPDAGACSVRDFRDGLLPTIINTDGAWAGETFCIFKNQRQTETGWKVVANCSNPREHWTTDVRLTVKDNRLIWTSKRGTQTYSRCVTDFLMAAAR